MNRKLTAWKKFSVSLTCIRDIETTNEYNVTFKTSTETFQFNGAFVFPKYNRDLSMSGVGTQTEATVTTDYDLRINDVVVYNNRHYKVMEATLFPYGLKNYKLFEKIQK
jgi:hypothetical protein